MLQLATATATFVIQLHRMASVPPALRSLLENRNVLKAGVGCGEDANRLHRACGVTVRGLVDLSALLQRSDVPALRATGLRSLCRHLLHVDLDKDPAVRSGCF